MFSKKLSCSHQPHNMLSLCCRFFRISPTVLSACCLIQYPSQDDQSILKFWLIAKIRSIWASHLYFLVCNWTSSLSQSPTELTYFIDLVHWDALFWFAIAYNHSSVSLSQATRLLCVKICAWPLDCLYHAFSNSILELCTLSLCTPLA